MYTCPCGMFGRYVRIRYPVNKNNRLFLCEVQIQPGGTQNFSIVTFDACIWVAGYLKIYYLESYMVVFNEILKLERMQC